MNGDETVHMQKLQDGVENLVEKIERQSIRPERVSVERSVWYSAECARVPLCRYDLMQKG